jgi:hypothetical protein
MTARELAREIAADLFTNAAGNVSERLILEFELPSGQRVRDGGGWCYTAAVDRIEAKLKENLFWSLS